MSIKSDPKPKHVDRPKGAPVGVDEKHANPAPAKHDEAPDPAVKDTEPKSDNDKGPAKSIVPSKYAGKYKNGGSDPLAVFLTEHSAHPETKEFDFDRFFDIAHANGVDKAHTEPFKKAIADKAPGAQGRARMTIRNRLDAIVRKAGHVKDAEGKAHDMKLADRAPRPVKDKAESVKEPVTA